METMTQGENGKSTTHVEPLPLSFEGEVCTVLWVSSKIIVSLFVFFLSIGSDKYQCVGISIYYNNMVPLLRQQ